MYEVSAADGSGLDEPPHGRAVAGKVAGDHICGVRVRVEVDDSDLPPSARSRNCGCRWPRDRMVATEDDREDVPVGDLGDALADRRVRQLDHPVGTDRIAVVDDLQGVEQLDP